MVRDPPVLHPAGAEDLPPILHDTGTAGVAQHPPGPPNFSLACLLPLECVFLSAGRLGWPDQSFLVVGGGGTVLPGVAVFDDFSANADAASRGAWVDRSGAGVPSGNGGGGSGESTGLCADDRVFGRAG